MYFLNQILHKGQSAKKDISFYKKIVHPDQTESWVLPNQVNLYLIVLNQYLKKNFKLNRNWFGLTQIRQQNVSNQKTLMYYITLSLLRFCVSCVLGCVCYWAPYSAICYRSDNKVCQDLWNSPQFSYYFPWEDMNRLANNRSRCNIFISPFN